MYATEIADSSRTTPQGTPCARSWTDEWIAHVETREEELGRRICGARTIGHAPCPGVSAHPSGRCVHHGGFDLTGAPEGNRNAAVHFLYARRLMPCGSHCPNWNACPLGGGSIDHGKELLSRREPDRPTCPYEQAEYTACVTDAMRRTQNHHENAWGLHVAHQVALMTVLVSRAARALSTQSFTQAVESYQGEHLVLSERPAAALTAYDKLSRELRRWTILLERGYAWISCDRETAVHHKHRQTADTAPDPDSLTATATYPNPQHRGTEQHRESQEPKGNRQDEQANCHPRESGDLSSTTDNGTREVPAFAGMPKGDSLASMNDSAVKDRIDAMIAAVAPELFNGLKISDPPGNGLHRVLNPAPT